MAERGFSFDKKYLRMSLMKGEIAFWYESGEGQTRFTILPKFINLDKGFFELLGILDGEMSKKISKSGGSSIKISNAEPLIMKELVNRFEEYFQIHKDSWTASITINDKMKIFKRDDDLPLKLFWSKKIGIPKDRFTKTTLQRKYFSKFSKKGIIQIRYGNTLFFKVFLEIMNGVRKLIINNTNLAAAYLRGVAAAEGGIGKRGEKIRIFHIGGIKKEDRDFYSKCLEKIGITSIQDYKLRVEVCGLENFKKLKEIDILKYHPRRKSDFLISLENLEKNYKRRFRPL